MNGVLVQIEDLTRFGVGPLGCPPQAQLFGLGEAFGYKSIHTNACPNRFPEHMDGTMESSPNIHIHPTHTINTHS